MEAMVTKFRGAQYLQADAPLTPAAVITFMNLLNLEKQFTGQLGRGYSPAMVRIHQSVLHDAHHSAGNPICCWPKLASEVAGPEFVEHGPPQVWDSLLMIIKQWKAKFEMNEDSAFALLLLPTLPSGPS
ncbi:hypothetical protein ABBQ38_001386 [Trebouxia sp. C0009 RCD-2024]